jgi:hypothetical protein
MKDAASRGDDLLREQLNDEILLALVTSNQTMETVEIKEEPCHLIKLDTSMVRII